ncbi:MAG: LIC_10190 family membrane protein [Saprospiraceae bacterium]
MLIVIANWLFILVISGAWGFAAYRLLRRWTDPSAPEASLTTTVLLGLMSLTTLCNLCSLWVPIGKEVCLLITACVPFLIYLNRHSWPMFIKRKWTVYRVNPRITIIYFLLLVIIAFAKTVGVSEIEDEAAYHLPLIRWIENYPVVPGIANIENRLGINPSIYLTNALFGLAWLYKGGLYDLNSFLFVLISGSFLSGLGPILRQEKDRLLSGIVQVAAFVFLFRIYLTSMDADFLNIYGVLYLLVFIIRQMEQSRFGHPDWQTVWSLLFFCFLVTNKFSAALLAPVACWLLYELIRRNQLRTVLVSIALGSLIVLSWVARNYYISGFAVCPVYFLDFFNVDWKLPPDIIRGQYHYVSEFAKTEVVRPFYAYVAYEPALKDWLPGWFQLIWAQLLGKLVIAGLALSLALWGFSAFSQKRKALSAYKLLAGLLFLAILAWFLRIPALRFGWPWLLVFICISVYVHFEIWLKERIRLVGLSLSVLLGLSLLRSTIASVNEGVDLKNRWLYPAPVTYTATYTTQYFNQIKIQVAPDDFCRDAVPPCFPKHYHPGLRARGKTVKEGFRIGY